MKNILITGTSTGVGLETSILLAKNGFKVYATMRNLAKADKLNQAISENNVSDNIEVLALDVTKADTIEKAVAHIIEQDGKLDILLNNAGAGFAKTTEYATMDEVNWVTDVNYYGVIRTTQAVIPHMREAKAGHIINITSVGGLVGQPFNEFYCGAKFAVEGYTESLACYVAKPFNLQFSMIEPGGIATEFMTSAVANTATETGEVAQGDYAPIMQQYLSGMQSRSGTEQAMVYQTGAEVAEVILQVIKDGENGNAPLRVRTSEWAEHFTRLKTQADPDGTKLVNDVIENFL